MLTATAALAPDGQPYQLTQLQNAGGMTVTLMDWGATWLSAVLPLKSGESRELLLGCRSPADYQRQGAYLGATVGRYANRIANASLPIDGKPPCAGRQSGRPPAARRPPTVSMPAAGAGYSTIRIRSAMRCIQRRAIRGFPGNLDVQVCYRLTPRQSRGNQLSGAGRSPLSGQPDQPRLFQSGRCRHRRPRPAAAAVRRSLSARRRRGHSLCRADAGGRQRHGFPPAENAAAGFSARPRPAAGKRLRSRFFCCTAPAARWSARRPIYGPPTGKCR